MREVRLSDLVTFLHFLPVKLKELNSNKIITITTITNNCRLPKISSRFLADYEENTHKRDFFGCLFVVERERRFLRDLFSHTDSLQRY